MGKEEVGSCGYIFLQLAYLLHTYFITTFLWLNQQYDATTILELFQTNPHFIINLVFLSLLQRNLTYYYDEQKSNHVPTLCTFFLEKNLQSTKYCFGKKYNPTNSLCVQTLPLQLDLTHTHVYLETLGCQNTKITRHIPDTFLKFKYQTISIFLNIHNSQQFCSFLYMSSHMYIYSLRYVKLENILPINTRVQKILELIQACMYLGTTNHSQELFVKLFTTLLRTQAKFFDQIASRPTL